eukprot:12620187-Ditylum_brightwellii.AAC.1
MRSCENFIGVEDGTLVIVSIGAGDTDMMVLSTSFTVYSGFWIFSDIKDMKATGMESALPCAETPLLQVHDTSVPGGMVWGQDHRQSK